MLRLEYLKILIFFIVAFLFVFLLISLSLLLNKNIFRLGKRKPVECGSHSFGSGKNKIEINFYLITILFIIFEIEFIILIPWLFFLKFSYIYSLVPIFIFLLLLTIGLIFEFCNGIFNLNIKK